MPTTEQAQVPPPSSSTYTAPQDPQGHTHPEAQTDEYSRSGKGGKFRFKSSRSSRSDSKRSRPYEYDRDRDREREDRHRDRHRDRHGHRDGHRDGHRHKHKHKHRSSHRHRSPHDQDTHRTSSNPPSPTAQTNGPEGLTSSSDAFRESLFDALGDDEGAAYWESVYGQPIHTFSVPSIPRGPLGELEAMDEEEYAAYVRSRMWERTREGMIEEQERRRAERVRQRRREEGREEERGRFEREVEESLRRGQVRKRAKLWRGVWGEYVRSWEEVDKAAANAAAASANDDKDKSKTKEGGDGHSRLRNLLFWPVETGKRKDVSKEAVEEFMRHAPVTSTDQASSAELQTTLKSERVRWHPDKIQHRYGSLGVDEVVMRSVTEVFQIVDTMWNELKGKHS